MVAPIGISGKTFDIKSSILEMVAGPTIPSISLPTKSKLFCIAFLFSYNVVVVDTHSPFNFSISMHVATSIIPDVGIFIFF